MEPVLEWTGRLAGALQRALRMSNEAFAEHLGVAARTVSTWHQKPERVPNPEMQRALDTALERAGEGAQARFEHIVSSAAPTMDVVSATGKLSSPQTATQPSAILGQAAEAARAAE